LQFIGTWLRILAGEKISHLPSESFVGVKLGSSVFVFFRFACKLTYGIQLMPFARSIRACCSIYFLIRSFKTPTAKGLSHLHAGLNDTHNER